MLEVSPTAATAIAQECRSRSLPETGGVRLYSRGPDGNVRSLAIEFLPEPRPGDSVLLQGDARVFLADNVGSSVNTRVLDVDGEGTQPRLQLRSRRKR